MSLIPYIVSLIPYSSSYIANSDDIAVTNAKCNILTQSPEVFYRKSCSWKFRKIHRKTPAPEFFLIKLQVWGLWHRCFPVNFTKFLRTPFFRRPLDDCFWISYVHETLRTEISMIVPMTTWLSWLKLTPVLKDSCNITANKQNQMGMNNFLKCVPSHWYLGMESQTKAIEVWELDFKEPV